MRLHAAADSAELLKTSNLESQASDQALVARDYYDRAKICASRGDSGGAIFAYETAITVAPDFAEAHSNLGTMYLQSGRREDARRSYESAIRAKPALAPLHCNLAAVLMDLERCDEAIVALETALRLAPDFYEAHVNLCSAYRRSGRDREALAPALRATALRPSRDAYGDLGNAAFNLDAFDVAIEANRLALEIDATCPEVHSNLGWVYHVMGRYTEAIDAFRVAIALRPDFARAHLNLALSLLICGDFKWGWDEYVWAWRAQVRLGHLASRDAVTLWSGEPFVGRQLLITLDEDFGDAIQMMRYLPEVKARGGRVIVEVKAPLIELFTGFPGVDELNLRSSAAVLADDVNLQIPMLGLPRALGMDLTSVPAAVPYLRAHPERVERWRVRLQHDSSCLRVGIAWAGRADHFYDGRRSVRLEDFAALGKIAHIAWFGLQKGRDENRQSSGSFTLDPLGPEIGDFADTAAIIAQLDLVIAVDTALVHLAGALGTPVWTLLPHAPDWRWLLGRADSPWYPTMRLFRQPKTGDWASVFGDVSRELRAFKSI